MVVFGLGSPGQDGSPGEAGSSGTQNYLEVGRDDTAAPRRTGHQSGPEANAQEITIDWIHGTAPETPASHTVTSGDLQPEFGLLFLRPPGPAEGDFLIAAHVDQQSKASQVKTARNRE